MNTKTPEAKKIQMKTIPESIQQIKALCVQTLFYTSGQRHGEGSSQSTQKWYVIFNGEHHGIYQDWATASLFIKGFDVIHKSYTTYEAAEQAYMILHPEYNSPIQKTRQIETRILRKIIAIIEDEELAAKQYSEP